MEKQRTWYIQIREYYLAIKRYEITIHATMLVSLATIIYMKEAKHQKSHEVPFVMNIQYL